MSVKVTVTDSMTDSHSQPDNNEEPTRRPSDDRIVWIDLEMTGLEPDKHVIVEVAALITDADLSIVGEGIDIVVHVSDDELSEMNDFVRSMHTSSGLIDEIRASQTTLDEAERMVIDLVDKHCSSQHLPPLAGNSIATDRKFIAAQMPMLNERLHYRMIDVSSIKELTRRWYPRAYYGQPAKGMSHRALTDIIESLRELDYYRRSVFVPDPGPTSADASSAARLATERFADDISASVTYTMR